MSNVLLFMLASIGLANIMVHGKVFDVIGLRCWLQKHMSADWYQLFECYECSGVWAGWFCALWFCLAGYFSWWLFLPMGFVGSVSAQTYTDLIYWLRSKIEFTVNDAQENTEN